MTHRIGVIAGDGIGPEVVAEALKVLDASGVKTEQVPFRLGAERYLESGEVLPPSTVDEMRAFDAVLDPFTLVRVLNVHVLHADGAAIGVAKYAENLPQFRNLPATEPAGLRLTGFRQLAGDSEPGIPILDRL